MTRKYERNLSKEIKRDEEEGGRQKKEGRMCSTYTHVGELKINFKIQGLGRQLKLLDFLPSMHRALCKTGSVLRTVITAAGQQKKGQKVIVCYKWSLGQPGLQETHFHHNEYQINQS